MLFLRSTVPTSDRLVQPWEKMLPEILLYSSIVHVEVIKERKNIYFDDTQSTPCKYTNIVKPHTTSKKGPSSAYAYVIALAFS